MTSALAPATAHLAVRPRATTTARTAIRGNQPSTSPLLASSSRVSLAPLRAIAADAKADLEDAIPAVLGPGPSFYIVDSHHTLAALDYSGLNTKVNTMHDRC